MMIKLVLALSLTAALAGCETIKGAGRDVYHGVSAIASGSDSTPPPAVVTSTTSGY